MIKLDDNYRIETDAFNVILVYESERPGEKGKTIVTRKQSFFRNHEQALRAYVNRAVKVPLKVKSITARLDEIHKTIKDVVAKLESK